MLEAGFENGDQLSSVIALKQLITSWLESGDNYDNGEISQLFLEYRCYHMVSTLQRL